jgi:hypothetical protein
MALDTCTVATTRESLTDLPTFLVVDVVELVGVRDPEETDTEPAPMLGRGWLIPVGVPVVIRPP